MHTWIRPRGKRPRVYIGLIAGALAAALLIGCSRNPVQRRDSYFQSGKKYYQQEKYADAAIEFQNAVKIDNRFVQGYYYLGLTRRERGNLQGAFQAFSKVLEIDPKQTPASLQLGSLYLMGRRPKEAMQIAEGVLTREPQNSEARLLLAQSYLGQKKYAEALKEFEKVKAARPQEAPVYLAIGIAQLGTGDSRGAEASFRRGIELKPTSVEGYRDLANLYQKTGRPAKAEQTLQEGLKATGNAQALYFALADFYYRWGRLTDAQAAMASLEKGEKPSADLHSQVGDFWVARNRLQLALAEYQAAYAIAPSLLLKKKFVNAYITQNNVAEAERWNQEILKANPKDRDGLLFAGAITYLRGDNAAAAEQLQKQLENNAQSVFGHYYLGMALMAMGKNDAAKSQFFDCLKTDPVFSYAFLRLGQLSLRARDAAAATQYAQEVVRSDPYMLDGYLLATDAAILSGNTGRAGKALQVAHHIAPDSLAVRLRQAILDGVRKDYAKAEREYQSVLAQAKDPTPILAGLAQLYVEQKQTGQAIREISSYTSGPKANAELFALLARLHILQNDLAAASSDCHRALQLNGQSAQAYYLLGRIAEMRGNDTTAIQNYARAGQLFRGDGLPNLLAGNLSQKLRRWRDAQKYYQLALKQSPGLAGAQAGLARAMVELGEDANVALSLAQQARAAAPTDANAADTLGWVYVKRGMPQLAIPLLQQSVDKMPKEADFRFHLGMAYSAAGKKLEARRSLLEARQLGLSDSEAKQVEETLAALNKSSKTK